MVAKSNLESESTCLRDRPQISLLNIKRIQTNELNSIPPAIITKSMVLKILRSEIWRRFLTAKSLSIVVL